MEKWLACIICFRVAQEWVHSTCTLEDYGSPQKGLLLFMFTRRFLQAYPIGDAKYDLVDGFAGRAAISRAFREEGFRSASHM